MRIKNIIKKAVLATTAFALVSTAAPLTGQAHAAGSNNLNAYAMVQNIFDQVGLANPLTGKGSSAQQQDQTEQPAQPQQTAQQQEQQPAQQPQQTTQQPQQEQQQPAQNTQDENTSDFGDRIIATGEKYLGTPYKFGSSSKTTKTFDCSSFTQRVFAENGVKLPRTAEPQSKVGVEVPRSELQKGDLVFFKLKGKEHLGIEHVGIYAGNGKILHTYGPGGVRYDDMSKRWLDWGFVKATRVRP
ncbi:cell wall-associated NlpC family hydrolase [Melghirimyces profundicolus]|uniref:Cell wall-associated NlpC family hydrolase n=1 Tax=Melghirimyces profundicolus TaxID=1242148 RepID=A0A2T6BXP3_9BACL|nr:C40 family peptidase [Melghirimyces profundicolus]PTX60823.1 cell wall-associated NlpC family hydrolase [Melghirimyces profundicolus]